jgi:hypothetical protein
MEDVLDAPMGEPRLELVVGAIGLMTTVEVLERVTVDGSVVVDCPYAGGGPYAGGP